MAYKRLTNIDDALDDKLIIDDSFDLSNITYCG